MQRKSLLDDNLNKAPNSFYQELVDNCKLDEEKFNDLTKYVLDLHRSDLSQDQRLGLAIKLWEFGFLVSRLLRCHHDSSDVYMIENLDEDDDRQIDSILYYLCNWFSYNKELDEQQIKFGSW